MRVSPTARALAELYRNNAPTKIMLAALEDHLAVCAQADREHAKAEALLRDLEELLARLRRGSAAPQESTPADGSGAIIPPDAPIERAAGVDVVPAERPALHVVSGAGEGA